MTHWRAFIVALVLPLLFTAMVLLTVLRNRAGGREAFQLTEREVTLSTGSDDNSGVTAWLVWTGDGDGDERWVPEQTLRALGFDLTPESSDASAPRRDVRQLQRRAYVVLELRDQPLARSRLVPVDASPDAEVLREKYPDGRIHLVTAGFIGLRRTTSLHGGSSLVGYLAGIDPRGLHVPTRFASRLRQKPFRDRRFTLSVRYGSQLEPWIVAVE